MTSEYRIFRVPTSAGRRAAAQVAAACPDLAQQASALRWALRGLAVPLAIRKARLDTAPPESATPRQSA